MNTGLLHPADQIVMVMKRIYRYGMTTMSGGNLSIKDDNGDVWITPAGIDKGSLTAGDIVQVKPDGTIIGRHKPSSELPFHLKTYRQRPDIRAVLHAHSPALVSFSIVRKIPDTKLIPDVYLACGEVGMAEYGLTGSDELGEKIAKVLEKGINTVLLENHGIVVVAKDLFEAFLVFETLDFSARLEINARRIGNPVFLGQKDMEVSWLKNHFEMEEFVPAGYSSCERKLRSEMCGLIQRAYDQRLFTGKQGTFSARVDDHSFIITPGNADRKYIDAGHIVRIENGRKEAGKIPCPSVLLHKHIYEKNPHVNSVIIAQPVNIMTFAVTDVPFDSRLIPESYIMLRDIPKVPYGLTFMQPEKTAELFRTQTPMIIAQNECVIITGNSLLNAYDRLEVAEFSARALIDAMSIGNVVKINDEQIDELKRAFNPI